MVSKIAVLLIKARSDVVSQGFMTFPHSISQFGGLKSKAGLVNKLTLTPLLLVRRFIFIVNMGH